YHKESGNSSVIGYGTYGKVFKAVDVYTGKAVALKRLRLDTERDGFPITAAREMQILKFLDTLKSTQVITLIEVLYEERTGVRPPDCVMVFEYMPHDLTGLMSHPSHTLTSAEKKHLSLQLISALDFIHGHNIMHRDVKAANILVNDKGLIKLADFGLARRFEPDGHPNFTNRVVTIWYRAPELLYGSPNYTVQIDFWAAACVMIEIFTGAAIFPGNGKEQNQMIKLWELLGWPTEETWPGVSQLPWYFLVRPKVPYNSCFAEKYRSKVSPELLNLFTWMFTYDPKQRPNAAQIMKHPFFTTEQPRPEQ
ncbi:Pkinase-domain-containing protein, partial [Trichodelitschia bisporula]